MRYPASSDSWRVRVMIRDDTPKEIPPPQINSPRGSSVTIEFLHLWSPSSTVALDITIAEAHTPD